MKVKNDLTMLDNVYNYSKPEIKVKYKIKIQAPQWVKVDSTIYP